MEKINIDKVVLVEGKYDKIKLEGILNAVILTTNGFSVFNKREKYTLIKMLAEKRGLIILTDSDRAGFVIRNKLRGILPSEKITHLYIPAVTGREKRKKKSSKEQLLGVEGIDANLIRNLFLPFSSNISITEKNNPIITKADFYNLGLSGGIDSREKRNLLAKKHNLPENMSTNALIEALNLLDISLWQ